jgi:fructokinase
LEQSDFFKVSDEEALLLTGMNNVMEAAKMLQQKTSAVFAITLGSEGTLFRNGDTLVTIPSIEITPTDTTGAGDAFVGAILYQLAEYSKTAIDAMSVNEWTKIVVNGNKAGARTCEYMGAMEAFKFLNSEIFN